MTATFAKGWLNSISKGAIGLSLDNIIYIFLLFFATRNIVNLSKIFIQLKEGRWVLKEFDSQQVLSKAGRFES